MIDTHSHVLAGLDDGAETLDESVAMARRAAAKGVTRMVATPHIRDDFDVAIGELPDRVAELNGALRAAELELIVHQGGEVAFYRLDDLTDDDLRSVSFGGASRYVLVETPYGSVPAGFEEALFRLALRGFTAVVAHPERSPSFQRHPERLTGLVERGMLLQLTAGRCPAPLAGPPATSRSGSSPAVRLTWSAPTSTIHAGPGPGWGRRAIDSRAPVAPRSPPG